MRREREKNWILDATWKLVDARAKLQKVREISQYSLHKYNCEVKVSLYKDRAQCNTDVDEVIKMKLNKGELKEAWRKLKDWYSIAEERAYKPFYLSVENQSQEGGIVWGSRNP